ncbi:hypothetical protein DICPUDRAFT_156527 [Dictyostelium purpureum]|uniref:N-acetyltransferase domain-containing protein n=1 Tax=Dictyostelium purpureum TaxID=5786 RepID=F0ZWT3_DICPU|nr:uncharacterized protein DICPUDRAFT_156527 [Dictyostelium purpureum]EGC31593.1 hypothetical protein DICPUDRAFT_156527 [Dictyostelium purpureum]|eukprot:XP_003291877.1 hypothetical protein DICPUDRAFT_156527 [Dictyostelium purpureum]
MSTLILKSNTDTNFFSSSSSNNNSNKTTTTQSNDESSSSLLSSSSPSTIVSLMNQINGTLSGEVNDPSTLSLAPLTQMMSFAALAPSTSEFAINLAQGTMESSLVNNNDLIELRRTPGESNSLNPNDVVIVDDFRPGSNQTIVPIVLSHSTKVPDPADAEVSRLLQLKSSLSRTVTVDGYVFREVFDPDQDEGCKQALQLYSQSFFEPTEPSVNHIANLARSHFYRILIMEDENQKVLACAFIVEIHEYKCYHIDYLCVRPDSRGGGLGGKFFKQLSNYLRTEQRYLMITLESETKMVGWYLKQSCLHLNVMSDQFTDETGETLYWWLLIVPLGKVIDDNSDSDTDSDEPLSSVSALPPASLSLKKRSKSYILHNGSIFYEFNQYTLKTIVTAVKSLLLFVSVKK